MTVIDEADDLRWLKEVHGVPSEVKFAIIHGNEDAPNKIEGWFVSEPQFDTPADFVKEGEKVVRETYYLAGWGDDMERLGVRQRTFGHLVRLADVVENFRSDLYHDAQWLRNRWEGEPFFYWAGAWGTAIGTAQNLVGAFGRDNLWKITVAKKNGGAWYITIERVR